MKNKLFQFVVVILVLMLFFWFTTACKNLYAQTDHNPESLEINEPDNITGRIQHIEGTVFGIGTGFSFSFDNENVPSVAYYNLENNELKYAKVEKGRWVITTVAKTGISRDGLTCFLAFDSNNTPYIAYVSQNNNLSIASLPDKEWKTEIVDHAPDTGYYCRLTFLPNNQPVVTYQGAEGLMIAQKVSDTWQVEPVADTADTTGIPVILDNQLYVYYICTGQVKIAARNNNQWSGSVIPGTENCLDFDVTVNEQGIPLLAVTNGSEIKIYKEQFPGSGIWHKENIGEKDASYISVTYNSIMKSPSVAYLTKNNTGLEVAQKLKDEWVIDNVATAREGYKFKNASITSDSKGRETVLLHDGDSLLTLVQQREGWGIGRIDGKIRVGGYISSVVFPDGKPAAAYYDYSRQQLHYAVLKDDNNWSIEIVDALGDVGRFASIAVSQTGIPGIAYHDKSRKDLKYAWKEGNSWRCDRVDYSNDTGYFPSLAFDETNTPNIAYFNPETKKIYLAIKQGKDWKREEVASTGDGGGQSVLFIKPGKDPLIFYVDGDKTTGQAGLKIAERDSSKNWTTSLLTLVTPLPVENNSLSGHKTASGEICVAFIDYNDDLVMVENTGSGWRHETVDSACLKSASIKYDKDGIPNIIYLKRNEENMPAVHLARKTPGGWDIRMVEIPDKEMNFLSLINATESHVSFVYENSKNFFATFFESNQE
jgi:hypothetical protein